MIKIKFPEKLSWGKRLFRARFLSQHPALLLMWFSFISVTLILVVSYFAEDLEVLFASIFPQSDSLTFVTESLKLLGAAVFAGFAALLFANVWQQKSLGFELLRELNSVELLEARNDLANQKKICRRDQIDLENITHWFPHNNSPRLDNIINLVKIETFRKKHALSFLVYYIIRLSNYSRNGMLDIAVTKSLFHTFFAHHEVVILEFVQKFENYVKYEFSEDDYNNYPYNKSLWTKKVDDIRYFFKLIGLNGQLPEDHVYIYFPSLNKNKCEAKDQKYASDQYMNEIDVKQAELINEIANIKDRLTKIEQQIEQTKINRKRSIFRIFS